MTPRPSPAARAYRGAGGARPARGARPRPPGARRPRGAVRPPRSALGLVLAREPELLVWLDARPRARARGRDHHAEIDLALATRPSSASSCGRVAGRARGRRRTNAAHRCGSAADEERTIELTARCARWGAYGSATSAARPRPARALRLGDEARPANAAPGLPARRSSSALSSHPLETQVFAGNQVARPKGEGIEFADLRRYAAGDRSAAINWRASARRGELVVNEQHPERNADVILFLDTFVEARAAREVDARPGRARGRDARRPATSSARTASAWSASAASCTG